MRGRDLPVIDRRPTYDSPEAERENRNRIALQLALLEERYQQSLRNNNTA